MKMNNYRLFSDKNITAMETVELYNSVGWEFAKQDGKEFIDKVLENTTAICYVRNDSSLLIGLVRIFSDYFITTYISEIVVHNEYQQKGIGRLLMEKVKIEFNNTSIFFESLPGTEGFAEKCGFRKQKGMSV